MSKISEQKALEAYPIDIIPDDDTMGFTSSDRNEVIRLGYIKGYDQAMKDFLWKACEWLKGNSKKYVVCYEDGYSHYAYNSMIDDFKNYIQNAEI